MKLPSSGLKYYLFSCLFLALLGCNEDPYESTSTTLASLIHLEVASAPIDGKYCEVMPSAAVSQAEYDLRVSEVSECTLSGDIAQFTDSRVGMTATFGEDATSSGMGAAYLNECRYERSKYLRIITSDGQFACWDAPYKDVVDLIVSTTNPNNSEQDCANLYTLDASQRYQNDWACLKGKTSVFARAYTPIDIDFSLQACPAGRIALAADIAAAEDSPPRAASDTEKRRLLEEQNLSINCDTSASWSISVPEEFGPIAMGWYRFNTSALATPSVWSGGAYSSAKYVTFTATSNPVLNNQSISRKDACLWSVVEFGGGVSFLFGDPIVNSMTFDAISPTRESNLCVQAPAGVNFTLETSDISVGNQGLECLDLSGTNQNLCYPTYAVHSQNPSIVTKLSLADTASNNLSLCTKIEGGGIPNQYVQDICVTETLLDNDNAYTQWGSGQPSNGDVPDGRELCSVMNPDGSWSDAACEENRAFACRLSSNVGSWIITGEQDGWATGDNACRAAGSYPGEYVFAKPNNEYENLKLTQAIGSASVWINYLQLDPYFLVNLIGEQPRFVEQVVANEKIFTSFSSFNLLNLGIATEHLYGDAPLKYTYNMACHHDGADPRSISLSAVLKNSSNQVIAESSIELDDPCTGVDGHEYFVYATGFENVGAQAPERVEISESFIQSNVADAPPETHHGLRMLPPNLMPQPYFSEEAGWEVEAPWDAVTGRQGKVTAIRSLESNDTVSHTIDLVALGFSASYMDTENPEIITSLWAEVFSCDDDSVTIELLDAANTVVADYYMELNDIVAEDNCDTKSWLPLSRILSNYPDGVRKIRWTLNSVNRHWTSESEEGSKFEAPYVGILPQDAYNKLRLLDDDVVAPQSAFMQAAVASPCGGYNQPFCEEWTTGQQAATVAGAASLITGGGICAIGILTSWFTFGTSAALCVAGGFYGVAGGVAVGVSVNTEGLQYCTAHTGLVVNGSTCECPSGKQWSTRSYHCVVENPLLDPFEMATRDVESNLATLFSEPSATLTSGELSEMEGILDRYKLLYDQSPSDLSQLKEEANIEWYQRIAYFQLDRLYADYLSRLHEFDDESTRLASTKSDIENMIARSPDTYSHQDYFEFAKDISVMIGGAFSEIIFDRVCSTPGRKCAKVPNEQDIHRALFWSALVYENKATIEANLVNGPLADNIYDNVELSYFDYDGWLTSSSQAFLAVLEDDGKKDVVISFRGTNISSYDIVTDSRFLFSSHNLFPHSNISVHSGFQSMWNRHKSGMFSKLDDILSDNNIDQLRSLYIVGHSLGGGVATVSAPEIALHLEQQFKLHDSRRIKLINFGSPRTGNQNWSSFITGMDDYFSHVLIRNNRDIIASVPWELNSYRHLNNVIKLPDLPVASSWSYPWPENWDTYLPGLLVSLYEASTGLEGADFKHHGTQAYKFNVGRYINPLPVDRQQNVPENCIAYQQGVGLMNEPCEASYRYACEVVNQINFSGSVGKDSVQWSNTWEVSQNDGPWVESTCGAAKFSMPVRDSDLVQLEDLMYTDEKIWVNYNRTPLK